MQLIRDRLKLPEKEVRKVSKEGELRGKEKEETIFLREVLGEIYLTRENAFSIAIWMLEKALPEEIGQEEIQEVLIKEFEIMQEKRQKNKIYRLPVPLAYLDRHIKFVFLLELNTKIQKYKNILFVFFSNLERGFFTRRITEIFDDPQRKIDERFQKSRTFKAF